VGAPGLLDVVASAALLEERALASLAGEPVTTNEADALEERIADSLRIEEVRERFRAASSAPEGKEGEPARRRFRVLSSEFLRRGTAAAREEIDGILTRDWLSALALEDDAERRKELHRLWTEEERELAEPRAALRDETERLARDAGASGTRAFLDAGEARPPAAVLAAFTRDAVAPLDERTAAAARARRSRFRPALPPREHASDVPPLATLADHAGLLPAERIAPTLRHLLAQAGEDSDADGPRLRRPKAARASSLAFEHARPRPAILLSTMGGPGALHACLVALGRAFRASVLLRQEDPDVVATLDPAFAAGAGTLFGRLVLSGAFREWCGLSLDPDALRDLAFETALVPRAAWARLALAEEAAGDEASLEIVRRATGRDPCPGDVEEDRSGASELRGIVFGALLEERLLTRFGRRWFLDRGAARFLRECHLGEPGETVESMAGELRLGTIEPAPIVDVFRP
jgi:hypothetical protein